MHEISVVCSSLHGQTKESSYCKYNREKHNWAEIICEEEEKLAAGIIVIVGNSKYVIDFVKTVTEMSEKMGKKRERRKKQDILDAGFIFQRKRS